MRFYHILHKNFSWNIYSDVHAVHAHSGVVGNFLLLER